MDVPRLDRRWLLGALAAATLLRLFRLGHQSLWEDELISLGLATYADGEAFWRGLLLDIHGPFNSAILHLWSKLGRGEVWLRLLYVVPSVATVALVYRLGANLFGERAGRFATVAAAISPFHVWYAQEVRSYSWAVLWMSAALIFYVRVWHGRAPIRAWSALAIFLALGVLTNYSAVFLLFALSVGVALRRPFSRPLVLGWTGVLLFVGLVFLPWFLDWFQRIGGERMFVDAPSPMGVPLREASEFSWASLPYVFWTFSFGYSLGPSLRALHFDRSLAALLPHLPVLVTGAAAIGIAVVLGLRESARNRRLTLVLTSVGIPLALSLFLAAREIKTFHPRYVIASFPVFLCLLGAAWAGLSRAARVSGGAAMALAVISLAQLYWVPAYAKENSRAAAQLVRELEQPGDAVVVIYSFRPFRHYFADTAAGQARLHRRHKRFLQTDDDMRRQVADAREDSNRVWLVLSRWWDVAPEPRIRRIFEEVLDEKGRWEFEGITVTLYEGRPS